MPQGLSVTAEGATRYKLRSATPWGAEWRLQIESLPQGDGCVHKRPRRAWNTFLALTLFALILAGCQRQGPPADPAAPPAPETFTLAAVGDILLDRGVGRKIGQHGTDYPFQHVADVLSAADVTFGNLECPLSENGAKAAKPYSFKAKPATAQCLVRAGFDVLSLANNHTMDCGPRGLLETFDHLGLAGIRWCGAGRTRAEAEAATLLTVKGISVAFVGFSDFPTGGSAPSGDTPAVAFTSEDTVRERVAAARRLADVVVASFHWGVEYASRPTQRQTTLARVAAAAGADLVLGHHPHVLQGFEVTGDDSSPAGRTSLIAYSLGNFVFDQRGGQKVQGAILVCNVSKAGIVSAEAMPVRIEGFRPRLASPAEASEILARLAALSAERNTTMKEGHVLLPHGSDSSREHIGRTGQTGIGRFSHRHADSSRVGADRRSK